MGTKGHEVTLDCFCCIKKCEGLCDVIRSPCGQKHVAVTLDVEAISKCMFAWRGAAVSSVQLVLLAWRGAERWAMLCCRRQGSWLAHVVLLYTALSKAFLWHAWGKMWHLTWAWLIYLQDKYIQFVTPNVQQITLHTTPWTDGIVIKRAINSNQSLH